MHAAMAVSGVWGGWVVSLAKGGVTLLGKGRVGRVHFLFDDWAGLALLCHLFPWVFRVVSDKEASVSVIARGLMSSLGCCLSGEVCVSLRSSSMPSCQMSFANIFICSNEEDVRIWKPSPFEIFSVKRFCAAVEGFTHSAAAFAIAWMGLAPP